MLFVSELITFLASNWNWIKFPDRQLFLHEWCNIEKIIILELHRSRGPSNFERITSRNYFSSSSVLPCFWDELGELACDCELGMYSLCIYIIVYQRLIAIKLNMCNLFINKLFLFFVHKIVTVIRKTTAF